MYDENMVKSMRKLKMKKYSSTTNNFTLPGERKSCSVAGLLFTFFYDNLFHFLFTFFFKYINIFICHLFFIFYLLFGKYLRFWPEFCSSFFI